MRILFFTKGNSSVASSRQRVWRVAERLHKQYGWDYEVLHSISYSLFSLRPSRFKILWNILYELRVASYELLFIHKSLYPWDIVLLIILAKKLLGKKLVYDLDDAEWIHSPKKSAMFARYADIVFCGSHEILAWARKYNNNAVFVPTALDADLYKNYIVEYHQRDLLTIGWVGQGKAHFKGGNFVVIKDALIKLCEQGIPFRFVIAGAQNYPPLHEFFLQTPFEVVFVDEADWLQEDTVPKLIHKYAFDVGVMPLVDIPFNRAKCAFKALEYMACGVPTVASPVGEALYVMKNKINGFLVQTPEEWALALKTLLKDISLRKYMGEVGLKFVQEHYSYQKIIPQIHAELMKLEG